MSSSQARSCSTAKQTPREILPTNVKPTHYTVVLEPDLVSCHYKGNVDIALDVKEGSFIELNDLEINFDKVYASQNGSKIEPSKTVHDTERQTTKFEFSPPLSPGKANLSIDFNAEINDKLAGFYRSTYESNGKSYTIATTQMESTDCRRAFPCFDEPALKATFDITLITAKDLTSISNMDVKSESINSDGKKVSVFNTTPIMSTYLVAFTVGELDYVESNDFRIPVRVYYGSGEPVGKACKFAADFGAKCLEFYEKKFGIAYPLPKLDMAGLHDFSAGAMENWGLVTYRLTAILYDPEKDSLKEKKWVGEVVAHELAHQWFGNLVTMEWWDNLWLNEGFATWSSWYCCNHFFPEWKVWESYTRETAQACLLLDSQRASHPIQVSVARAADVMQIFDNISYLKGSSVITMIADFLGEDVFIKGVSKYLHTHKYQNTVTSDLWNALEEVSGKKVADIMDVWTANMGFPVVKVEENGSKAKITQNRFLSTGDVTPEDDKVIYPLDLAIKTRNGVENKIFRDRSTTIDIDPSFYKLNDESSGLYRVSYPSERIIKLCSAGKNGLLSVRDRIALVADASALASAGYQKTSAFFDLISEWNGETSSPVWSQICSDLSNIQYTFDGELSGQFKSFRAKFILPVAKNLGYEAKPSDDPQTTELRSILYSAALSSGEKDIVQDALDRFHVYVEKGEIDVNLRMSVFSAAAKYGTDADYANLSKLYKEDPSQYVKKDALVSLGRSKNAKNIVGLLQLIINGEVRTQDVAYLVRGLAGNREAIDAAFPWLLENWNKLKEVLPPALGFLGGVIKSICSGLYTEKSFKEFEEFFYKVDQTGIDRSIATCKDSIKTTLNWHKRDLDDVKGWFSSHGYK